MKEARGFVKGMITMLLIVLLAGAVFAEPVNKMLEATYRNIIITIDGEPIEPKDAGGNTVEPFIVGGSTYLPVRAVAEAVGYDVNWIDEANTVTLYRKIIVILNISSNVFHLSEYCIGVRQMLDVNREDIVIDDLSEIPGVTEGYMPCGICAR
jgi:hypothetical protein